MNSFFSKVANRKKEEPTLLNTFQFNFLLLNTVYILPLTDNTISNRIFIDFINFRKFVNRSNFNEVSDHFIGLIVEILKIHKTVELHLNLKKFSITATEKYKDLVLMFYEKYQINYVNSINAVYIYNTPHVFEAIKTIFIKLSPLSSTFDFEPVLYSNAESPQKLADILKERMNSIYANNDGEDAEDDETTV